MQASTIELGTEYQLSLASYLKDRDEISLMRAFSLGKQALAGNLGVMDMVIIHHECLSHLLDDTLRTEPRHAVISASSSFLCEALSAYEITQQAFHEVTDMLNEAVRFGQIICHELRTPLTSLVNSVGMLEEVMESDPNGTEARLLKNISVSAEILRARTDELLDYVGFQAGTLSVKPTRLSPGEAIAGALDRMELEIQKAGLDLHIELAPDLPFIQADPMRFEQILSNLVQNAIKYGSDGGRLDVRAFTDDERFVMEVQDYGAGISFDDRLAVFHPTYRNKRKAKEVPGLGIGLALCKELVTNHHGTITLDSEEGVGSTFRVELPIR